MKLENVKIGQRFRFSKGGLVYIKDTVQGMDNQSSYSHSEKQIKTKNYLRKELVIPFQVLWEDFPSLR